MIRGFRRIGIALAMITVVIGMPSTGFWIFNEVNTAHNSFEQATCIKARTQEKWKLVMYEYDPLKIDLKKSGCDGPMYAEIIPVILDKANSRPNLLSVGFQPAVAGVGITAILAAAFLFFFWLLGWIFAGFAKT